MSLLALIILALALYGVVAAGAALALVGLASIFIAVPAWAWIAAPILGVIAAAAYVSWRGI